MLPLALLMTRQAYSLDHNKPLGRQSAGAGLLEAYFRYGGQTKHQIVVARNEEGPWFHQEALRHSSEAQTVIHDLYHWGDAGLATGNILLPGPGLDDWSWKRMPWGDSAFSLVGLVHTLCSRSVQWGLGQFATAPVRHWDALICTSTAAQSVVEGFLDRQEQWLQERLGAQHFERPQLPVVPLGIHSERWEPPDGNTLAREKARKQLGISPHAAVVLIAGRLDFLTKFQPEPLLRILAEIQAQNHPNFELLELVVYGEAPNPAMAEAWSRGAKDMDPNLKIHWVAGKQSELAAPVRWAADVFVSLADNPRETFGITPLEAMASGLPCIVSNWESYRDTVVQPNESNEATGFRITTRMIDGLGEEESKRLLHESLPYELAIGRVAQGIAVNLIELKKRLHEILANADLRHAMGKAGKRRVQRFYRCEVIMQQWSDILEDLQERRLSAQDNDEKSCTRRLPPWLPPWSTSFGSFASEILTNNWSPVQSPTPHQEEICHNSMMQNWDQTLLSKRGPRRSGLWLKHGLAKA